MNSILYKYIFRKEIIYAFNKKAASVVVLFCTLLLSCEAPFSLFSPEAPKSKDKQILNFHIMTPQTEGTIGINNRIQIIIPYGTDVRNLTPKIEIKGKSIDPPSEKTVDFSKPVKYKVYAEDGSSTEYLAEVYSVPHIEIKLNNNSVEKVSVVKPGLTYIATISSGITNSDIIWWSLTVDDMVVKGEVFPVNTKTFVRTISLDPPLRGKEQNIVVKVKSVQNLYTTVMLNTKPIESIPPKLDSFPFERIIPELWLADGGIQTSPTPTGSVYYYNSLHLREESDVQLDDHIKYDQSVKRYMPLSGKAVPDDSGFTDRFYHWVLFAVIHVDSNGNELDRHYATFPVDANNRFSGYIYFPYSGRYRIYATRQWDHNLYPRGTLYSVFDGNWTLQFRVNSIEGVPDSALHLLPSRYVDVGNQYIREYARYLTEHATTELEKAQALYHFLVFGDTTGQFRYEFYKDRYPEYADPIYSSYYLASHFLLNRRGVCNDFSELFAALARALGFKVQLVTGTESETEPGHMWNRILIDDRWYRLDATWANGYPMRYREYAEFYDEFELTRFETQHENTYNVDFVEKY